ncbi:MAG: GTP-binding protein, partial [Myxococcales bacterium]|nr:GTP-binding protein [Myxococcales bacterium]
MPVTVVTGFLGAGKTTLVERWLTELPGAAVIVNEAGAVGVDGALLSRRVARLREITGGCVCCATQAELAAALAELAASEPAPVRVLVETSGAA